MKTPARPGLAAVVIWSALIAAAHGETTADPAAPSRSAVAECDAMCSLGAYLSRDHMVTVVEVPDAPIEATAVAAAPAAPARSLPRPPHPTSPASRQAAAATRPSPVPLPVPAPAMRLAALPAPHRARQAALVASSRQSLVPAHPIRATAWVATYAVIPGSAPLVTPWFEPIRRR